MLLIIPKLKEAPRVRPVSLTQLVYRVTHINTLASVVFDIVGSRNRKE